MRPIPVDYFTRATLRSVEPRLADEHPSTRRRGYDQDDLFGLWEEAREINLGLGTWNE